MKFSNMIYPHTSFKVICHEGIKEMVMEQGRRVRSTVIGEIARRSQGQRFTLTFDEWTSGQNRRYMNINVHG